MHTHQKFFILFILFSLILSGCNSTPAQTSPANTVDVNPLITQVALTLKAQFTRESLEQALQTKDVPLTEEPTLSQATLLPTALPATSTPEVTSQAVPTLLPAATNTVVPAVSAKTPVPATAIPPEFAVIHVGTKVNTVGLSASCPPGYAFKFSGDITTNGPGDVIYNWEFSDGTKSEDYRLTFGSASSQTVSTEWTIGSDGKTPGDNPYHGWARITIVKPNNQVFPRAAFDFGCK